MSSMFGVFIIIQPCITTLQVTETRNTEWRDSTDNEVQSSKDSRNRWSLHGIDKQSVELSIGEIQTIQRNTETAEDWW